ncbi:MAG TPA: metal-sulfur cluster assembly factor [Caldilineaceae bacterium]|nr:metal-sulfur cluster assembly factor [Caldilineaceae bacterium]
MGEPLTPARCRDALRVVIDPEIYQNIVDLGLVYDIEVQPDQAVHVTMTLTTPHCPMGPQIIENVEKVLRELGASAVQVNIVWEPMWTPDAMTDELKRELGILPEEPAEPVEPEPALELPPPAPKKKGLLSRLFGF